MEYIFLGYFGYNLLVGIGSLIFYLFNGKGELDPRKMLWLTLFPAAGMGKWMYLRKLKEGLPTEFPEQWYVWKYMIRIHWGFMALLGLLPALMAPLMFFGLLALGTEDIGTLGGMESMIGAGIVIMVIIYVIIMLFMLVLPFLVLIYFPMFQKRKIEKARYYQVINEGLARHRQPEPQPTAPAPEAKVVPLFPELDAYIRSCSAQLAALPKERRVELDRLADHLRAQLAAGHRINLLFVCSGNAVRSQFGQIWAATAAAYCGIRHVYTFSGGTKETAFDKRAVEAIRRAGFRVNAPLGINPRHAVSFSDATGALECYSKLIHDPANPKAGLTVVHTCADAWEQCPTVDGAEWHSTLLHDDPKLGDRTLSETARHDALCQQLATEMLFLFQKLRM